MNRSVNNIIQNESYLVLPRMISLIVSDKKYIISNRELDNLKFSRFEGFSQAVYLLVFLSAGVFEDILTVLKIRTDKPLV